MKKKRSLRQWIEHHNAMESEIDTYVDGLDGICVVFPLELTEEGEKMFKTALDKCWVEDDCLIMWDSDETDDEEGIPACAYTAKDLIFSAGGWCSMDKYERWFK